MCYPLDSHAMDFKAESGRVVSKNAGLELINELRLRNESGPIRASSRSGLRYLVAICDPNSNARGSDVTRLLPL